MSKLTDKAADYFHGEQGYNCAQAVLKALHDVYPDIDDDDIAELKAYGGGRAPHGICGALFAAQTYFADKPEITAAVKKEFLHIVGAMKCREIRHANKVSCRNCVAAAVAAVEKLELKKE